MFVSLNCFVQTHPLTIVINNQMNNILSMLTLDSSKNICCWVEDHSLSLANPEKGLTDHVCLGF